MSSKSKPVYTIIDSMPSLYRSKSHKRWVALHKAQQWCLSNQDKEAINSLIGFAKRIKRRNN